MGDKEYVDSLLEFVYSRIVEKHKNLSAAYRLFDKQGKGHLSRTEFSNGLQGLHIRLAQSDLIAIFAHLAKGKGSISYNDFCHLIDTSKQFIDPKKLAKTEQQMVKNFEKQQKDAQ